jgi:hypothetical protein
MVTSTACLILQVPERDTEIQASRGVRLIQSDLADIGSFQKTKWLISLGKKRLSGSILSPFEGNRSIFMLSSF